MSFFDKYPLKKVPKVSFKQVPKKVIERGFKAAKKWFESLTDHGRFRKDFFYFFSKTIKKELGFDPYKCSECGITEHNGKVLLMDMDHIDGNPSNNKLSNIRFICPNCHWQAPTSYNRKMSIEELYESKKMMGEYCD